VNMKERVRSTLGHESVDRLPTQINYTGAMGSRMAEYFGVSISDLPDFLGNHLLRVDLSYEKRMNAEETIRYDWWGVGWNAEAEGYWTAYEPLAESDDLEHFAWPDPETEGLLDEAAEAITADAGQHFVVPNFGFCLFERAWSLRGFENLNMDMALRPDYVEALLERITEIQVSLARRFVALGVDGGYFGDDYGAQKHTLFSPEMWRQLFKPRLARMFAVFREAGQPVLMHSDGDIAPILPDLVEIGLTALNPVQPEVLDHAWLQKTFGGSLAFYGGVSTQTVLPRGTPVEVAAAVRECVATLAPDGTGLLLAPSHRLMSDIPLENVAEMLSAFGEVV
jgi:uroporphyrinogen decarboxylase